MRGGTAVAVAIAIACGAAFASSGCGDTSAAEAQARTLAYQSEIGRINDTFARAPVDPVQAESVLVRAIGRYRALVVPPRLRALHRRLIAELAGELRALRAARRAVRGGEASRLRTAVAVHARWQRAVSRTLGRIGAALGACRSDPSHC